MTRKSAALGEAGYARRPDDFYATEPWVTEALLDAVAFRRDGFVWEPACGDGRMAEVIKARGYRVLASDLRDRGYGICGADFLAAPVNTSRLSAIVTNPPYTLLAPFIERALDLAQVAGAKVAILARHEFDAPVSHHRLFGAPFASKLILAKRPRWVDGAQKASPRFPFAWYVWDWKHTGAPVILYP